MSDIAITTAQKRKIKNAIKTLNSVRRELQQENPDHYINWYLESGGSLNLMEGDSHDRHGDAQQDNVIDSFSLDNSGGGGW